MTQHRQRIVTLDLEGVLVPEIWVAIAERTGIDELRRTTRDEPDYDVLMQQRLSILKDHGLTMSMIQDVISTLSPLDGAKEFLDELRSEVQVLILSDTFEQFAQPLMKQLGWPTIWCHQLITNADKITDYQLRIDDQKHRAVEALRSLEFTVVAAGDSYNDTTMLSAAHAGFLFRAPQRVQDEFDFLALEEYPDLLRSIRSAFTELNS